jgi:hypothetical protein
MHNTSSDMNSATPSTSPRLKSSNMRRTISTFSSDIARQYLALA